MEDIVTKISSYNVLNYLLPGTVFAASVNTFTPYSLTQNDIVLSVFVYYFLGLVISRIGSIVIEPTLKWMRFVKFAEYKAFVRASKEDSAITGLSETNNVYRTFCALFLILTAFAVLDTLISLSLLAPVAALWPALALFLALFLFAYRKQTKYIVRRVDALERSDKGS